MPFLAAIPGAIGAALTPVTAAASGIGAAVGSVVDPISKAVGEVTKPLSSLTEGFNKGSELPTNVSGSGSITQAPEQDLPPNQYKPEKPMVVAPSAAAPPRTPMPLTMPTFQPTQPAIVPNPYALTPPSPAPPTDPTAMVVPNIQLTPPAFQRRRY